MINTRLGGITAPGDPPSQMAEAIMVSLNFAFRSSGIAISPMVEAATKLDPVMAEKTPLLAIVAAPSPARPRPMMALAASKSLFPIPVADISYAARTTSGMATNTSVFNDAYAFSTQIFRAVSGPTKTHNIPKARTPSPNPTGSPLKKINKKATTKPIMYKVIILSPFTDIHRLHDLQVLKGLLLRAITIIHGQVLTINQGAI